MKCKDCDYWCANLDDLDCGFCDKHEEIETHKDDECVDSAE